MVRLSSDNLLELIPAPPQERADAARNRTRILAAAEDLFAARGACNVSMDAIAEAAGVGKGTLYRRFRDQAGLAMALLEDKERRLQDAVLRGEPPLGPGAAPDVRLIAFVDALVDLLEAHTELHVLSESASSGARYRSGLYAFYRLHVQILLREIFPGRDAEYLSHALLAQLQADLFVYLRDEREMSIDRIKDGARALTTALVGTTSRVEESAD